MTVYCSDAVMWATEYEGPLHHAMLCDPPYHLSDMAKRYGKNGASDRPGGPFKGSNKGFMGQAWDGGDIAFRAETWAAFMRVLHPGAFCMAFASSRGFHRQAVAIEDAGFIVHPFIAWAFGSGFPKATRVKAGKYEEGELVTNTKSSGVVNDAGNRSGVYRSEYFEQVPADDDARAWSGHRYGLQALKPAVEPILVFQKPYEGRPLDCITRTGAGALNVDAGRIGNGGQWQWNQPRGHGWDGYEDAGNGVGYSGASQGRWPSNLIIGDPESAAMIDRQSGHLQSGKPCGQKHAANNIYGQYQTEVPLTGYGDSGGASRFFFNVQAQIDCADPVIYRAKAGRTERDAGLEGFDQEQIEANISSGNRIEAGAVTGPRNNAARSNNHPTVKPLSLTRYLASLLLPPPTYAPRRLYVPFSGVGSEMCGADLAGWEEVSGVEMSADYCAIAEARRRFWSCNSGMFETVCEQPETQAQGSLFT